MLPEERERPQPFEVDLDLEVELEAAGRSDRLEDTVDYSGVVDDVGTIIGGPRSYFLLEALADAIAQAPLRQERVRAVTVGIRKLRPPLGADVGTVGVRVTRCR